MLGLCLRNAALRADEMRLASDGGIPERFVPLLAEQQPDRMAVAFEFQRV
jgi:hypothetical protein